MDDLGSATWLYQITTHHGGFEKGVTTDLACAIDGTSAVAQPGLSSWKTEKGNRNVYFLGNGTHPAVPDPAYTLEEELRDFDDAEAWGKLNDRCDDPGGHCWTPIRCTSKHQCLDLMHDSNLWLAADVEVRPDGPTPNPSSNAVPASSAVPHRAG